LETVIVCVNTTALPRTARNCTVGCESSREINGSREESQAAVPKIMSVDAKPSDERKRRGGGQRGGFSMARLLLEKSLDGVTNVQRDIRGCQAKNVQKRIRARQLAL
jgi:hypothetical protein